MSLSPNSAIATLQALMQGGQGQAPPPDQTNNALAQMMGQGAPPPDAPTPMQAPQVPGQPPAPGMSGTPLTSDTPTEGLVGDPATILRMKQQEIAQQLKQTMAQLEQTRQVLMKDPSQDIKTQLGDFDQYNEDQYQKTYGGGGVLGTAGRAVANLLSGYLHKGQSIRDTLTAQNLAKYKEAVAAATQQANAQKAAAAAQAQTQLQQLNDLHQQQTQLNDAQKQIETTQALGIKAQGTPEAKDDEETRRRAAVVQAFKDRNQPLSSDDEKFYLANGKIPTPTTPKALAGTASTEDILTAHPDAMSGGKPLVKGLYYKTIPGENGASNSYEPTAPPTGQLARTTSRQQVIGYDSVGNPVIAALSSTTSPIKPGSNITPQMSGALHTIDMNGQTLTKTPLSAIQRKDIEASVGAIGNTIDIANRIHDHIDLLNSLIDAKKIQIQIQPDGLIKQVVARNVPLTDEETQMAADMQSIEEHINTLRGPLQATGFRGPQAWGALQGQAGNLSGSPEVSKLILESTIKALKTQQHIANKSLGKESDNNVDLNQFYNKPQETSNPLKKFMGKQ